MIKGVVVEGRPRAGIQFGLLLLIATPVARVVFSIFAFAAQRDWIYVGVSMIVLSILAYSLSGAGAQIGRYDIFRAWTMKRLGAGPIYENG